MAGSCATETNHQPQQETYGVQLDRELTRLGIKEPLKALFNNHPELASMKSIKEMHVYLAAHPTH
jgi:hypothetical protein